MADELDTVGKLCAEVTALRIVLQRLFAQLAIQTGQFEAVMRKEHAAALADLASLKILHEDPKISAAIRAHAEQVIDQMHTSMRPGKRPGG